MMHESQYIEITPDMMLKYYNRNNNNIDTSSYESSRLSNIFNIDINTYYCIIFCVFMFPLIIFLLSIILSFALK